MADWLVCGGASFCCPICRAEKKKGYLEDSPSWIRSRITLKSKTEVEWQQSSPSQCTAASQSQSDDLHRCADRHPLVKVDHVFVAHADAAGADGMADGPWLVGAMNAIKG